MPKQACSKTIAEYFESIGSVYGMFEIIFDLLKSDCFSKKNYLSLQAYSSIAKPI